MFTTGLKRGWFIPYSQNIEIIHHDIIVIERGVLYGYVQLWCKFFCYEYRRCY